MRPAALRLFATPLLATLLLPRPLLAEPGAAQVAGDRCRAVLAALPVSPAEPPAAIIAEDADTCRFEAVRFALGGPAGYEVAALRVRGWPASGPPRDLRIEARGVVLAVRTGTSMDWISRQQQVPFDVTLDVLDEPEARRITLRDLSMEGRSTGRVSLQAVIENASLDDSAPGARAAGFAGLRSLRFRLGAPRFLLDFVLPPLAIRLPATGTGEAVEAAKALAEREARTALAAAGAEAATIEAIAGLIRDFPRPRHPFALTVIVPEGTPPLTVAEVVGIGTLADLVPLLSRARIGAAYEGDFPPLPPP